MQEAINKGWFPIGTVDDAGNGLLHIACQNGLRSMSKLCVRNGADVNARNLRGENGDIPEPQTPNPGTLVPVGSPFYSTVVLT